MMHPFHLAIPVHDLKAARDFYTGLLGCEVGRRAAQWADFNFFGHQLSVHLDLATRRPVSSNAVDGKAVPVRHFGMVLPWNEWHALADRLQGKIAFIIAPCIRFKGKAGEQATMFFSDPSGNALEFKSFKELSQLFAAGTP